MTWNNPGVVIISRESAECVVLHPSLLSGVWEASNYKDICIQQCQPPQ